MSPTVIESSLCRDTIVTYLKLQNDLFQVSLAGFRKVERILHELIHLDQCVSSRS